MLFGDFVREKREKLRISDSRYSLRQVADRVGIAPTYLSKIECGVLAPPAEDKIRGLARELNEDPDVLLAMAGKVSKDLQDVIRKRPQVFSELIRQLKNAPDHAVLRVARLVRDGNW